MLVLMDPVDTGAVVMLPHAIDVGSMHPQPVSLVFVGNGNSLGKAQQGPTGFISLWI